MESANDKIDKLKDSILVHVPESGSVSGSIDGYPFVIIYNKDNIISIEMCKGEISNESQCTALTIDQQLRINGVRFSRFSDGRIEDLEERTDLKLEDTLQILENMAATFTSANKPIRPIALEYCRIFKKLLQNDLKKIFHIKTEEGEISVQITAEGNRYRVKLTESDNTFVDKADIIIDPSGEILGESNVSLSSLKDAAMTEKMEIYAILLRLRETEVLIRSASSDASPGNEK